MTFAKIARVPMALRMAGLVILPAGLFLSLATTFTEGRMTGGGSAFVDARAVNPVGTRVTHGFELQCNVTKSPNNLEVNWGNGNQFHLEIITRATCSSDEGGPTCDAAPPNAPFNSFFGAGIGSFNGVPGASAQWTFTDCGEPGTSDTVEINITDASGTKVLELRKAYLTFGNHQAHKR